jgi:hypothetical protein
VRLGGFIPSHFIETIFNMSCVHTDKLAGVTVENWGTTITFNRFAIELSNILIANFFAMPIIDLYGCATTTLKISPFGFLNPPKFGFVHAMS